MHDSQVEGKYIPVDITQCIWQNIAYAFAQSSLRYLNCCFSVHINSVQHTIESLIVHVAAHGYTVFHNTET